MKIKSLISLLSTCLVVIMSIFPTTVALADMPIQGGVEYLIIDNPEWAICPDGAVISEHTTFSNTPIGFLDKNGNLVRLRVDVRYIEGGLTYEKTGAFLPWKLEVDNVTYYYTDGLMTKWVGVFHGGLLILPGYGRVTHWTFRMVGEMDPVTTDWSITFQSGKSSMNLDAICAYFAHQ